MLPTAAEMGIVSEPHNLIRVIPAKGDFISCRTSIISCGTIYIIMEDFL